jgi:hypothetical protein
VHGVPRSLKVNVQSSKHADKKITTADATKGTAGTAKKKAAHVDAVIRIDHRGHTEFFTEYRRV